MPDASPRPGMGSTPYEGGVTFRIWAPNASAASVRIGPGAPGEAAHALAAEPAGLWSVDVDGLASGTPYRFDLTGPDGADLDRMDPWARHVSSATGNALVYDEDSFVWTDEGYRSPEWDDTVIYELHVGSFDEGPGDAVGTLVEVAAKLPYLADLGITAVELMPVEQFPEATSWGYDPSCPFAVDADLGGPDAFKTLVQAAHDAGIAVIVDVVYNHMGAQDNALWQFDGWSQYGLGGVYFYQDYRHSTPWGERPDYGRPEVRSFLETNAVDWLEQYRADGLRFDATGYIRRTGGNEAGSTDIPDGWRLLAEANDAIDRDQPWKLTIAEDLSDNGAITAPTASGGAGFGSQWDPGFPYQLRSTLTPIDDGARSMATLATAIERSYGGAMTTRVVFAESHDMVSMQERVPVAIDPAAPTSYWSKKRAALAGAVVMTVPGIPMLFMGEEFLATTPFKFDDHRPLNWSEQAANVGFWHLFHDLIALRRNRQYTTAGLRGQGLNVFHVNDQDKVIAYHRWSQGGPHDDVVVLCNFANRTYDTYTIGAPRAGHWEVRFCSDDRGYDPSFGGICSGAADTGPGHDWLPASLTMALGAYTCLILSQDT
jgi:1,4-alpha-glucan branching enzyme